MKETIKVLYNCCHGGFSVSKKALDLYNYKMKQLDQSFIELNDNWKIKRHDPILIEVFNELGNDFGKGSYTKIKIAKIPKKYENYYDFHEYDGLENVKIYKEKYKLDKIKEILRETNDANDKIQQIELLLQ